MSKPTTVLVPGAWHRANIYSAVAEYLHKYGYPTVLLPLPSAGATPPHPDFDGDVAAIRDAVSQLVSYNKEVVLVVHSYTGLPGGEAPKSLAKKRPGSEGVGRRSNQIRYHQ